MSKNPMAETKVPAFNLRMPESLKMQLQQAAAENDRSLNSEIVQRLRKSLSEWKLR
jgi:predicted HicB family RNase H-like nuclease